VVAAARQTVVRPTELPWLGALQDRPDNPLLALRTQTTPGR